MRIKKSDLFLIGAVLVIVIIGFFSTKGTSSLDIDYPLVLKGEAGSREITYTEYNNMVSNNEAFIVVIERTGCSYCEMYMPIIKEVADENKIPIYYINTDNLSSEEFELLNNKNSYLRRNSWGTPTTLLMYGNKVLDSIGGYVEKSSIEAFIKDKVVGE